MATRSRHTVNVGISLTPTEAERLRSEADDLGVPVSAIVVALVRVLEQDGRAAASVRRAALQVTSRVGGARPGAGRPRKQG